MTIIDPSPIANQITTTFINGGIKISAICTQLTLGMMLKILKSGTEQIKQIPAIPFNPEHGQQTVKYLQRSNNGDLHSQLCDRTLLRDLKKDFKTRGIDFAVEKGKDGKIYVHFKGNDVDSVKQGLTQAQARLEKRINRKEKLSDLKATIKNRVQEKYANKPNKSLTQTSPKQAPKIGKI